MKPFDYVVPSSLEEALAALHGDARPIAGGQSLLLEMKQRHRTPSRLVSLTALPELCDWSIDSGGELVVGAGTTYATLSAAVLPGWQGVVARVAGDLADRPVRTMGTIGGALCQADPRFDMPALAVGLDAVLELASPQGPRSVAAAELSPRDGGIALRPAEILTAVHFPALDRHTTAAFAKVRHRVFDAAVASATCALRLDGEGRVIAARLVLGAVAPGPIVLGSAAAALVDGGLDEASIDRACAAATAQVTATVAAGTRQQRYQRELVGVVVRRAITQARHEARS